VSFSIKLFNGAHGHDFYHLLEFYFVLAVEQNYLHSTDFNAVMHQK